VVLQGPGVVRITHCEKCGNVTTQIRGEQQLLQVMGLGLLLRPPGMRGEELRFLRTLYGMTQAALATALGLPRRETVAEWEARDRIFANVREEIAARLPLLHLFRSRILESDHCVLLDSHVQAYEKFVESFVDYAGRVLEQGEPAPHPAGFEVRLKQRRRWSPELLPS